MTSETVNVIRFRRNTVIKNWTAYCVPDRHLWGMGDSPEEAREMLARLHPETAGFAVEYPTGFGPDATTQPHVTH